MDNWIQHCYSRLLIDNHISEDDPSFMTCFDPQRYVDMVKKAGVEASMVYACDHNGNCYYPSQVGHMHRNLNVRDIFGETVILAARVAAQAEGGQILASLGVRELCAGKGFLFSDRGDVALRGFEDPVRLFEVRWREPV